MQIKNLANWAEKNKHCPFTCKLKIGIKWLKNSSTFLVPAGAISFKKHQISN